MKIKHLSLIILLGGIPTFPTISSAYSIDRKNLAGALGMGIGIPAAAYYSNIVAPRYIRSKRGWRAFAAENKKSCFLLTASSISAFAGLNVLLSNKKIQRKAGAGVGVLGALLACYNGKKIIEDVIEDVFDVLNAVVDIYVAVATMANDLDLDNLLPDEDELGDFQVSDHPQQEDRASGIPERGLNQGVGAAKAQAYNYYVGFAASSVVSLTGFAHCIASFIR